MRSRISVLAILIAFWLPAVAQTPAGSEGVSTSQFDLRSYQRELARIEEASKNPREISELRRSLPKTWTVKDGNRVYSVPTGEISDALWQIERDAKKPIAEQLKARLQSMQRQAEALSRPGPGASAAEADGKLKKILDRGEFQEAKGPSPWDIARARMNRWIFEHIIKLLNLLHMSQKTGNTIAWVVIGVAIVALFYAIYRWLTNSTKPADFHAETEPMASDARHWIQEALAAADRGDFREAVHCAYWASVAHLEDLRMLPRDRARTPRESLLLLEQHPKEHGVLQTLTRSFELIWYGYRPVSAAEWTGTREQLEKMGCLEASIAPTGPS
jgi:CHASE3 domain sensor protein